tara:strand:- start:10749 stop:12887 length:2139 start_codon:yes stop_codon:yes gene_type:complete
MFFVLYINKDYKTISLKANQNLYSKKIWEINTDSLSEKILSQMSLEEKIDQMYGEKMIESIPKFLGNYLFKNRFAHIYAGRNDRLNIPPWVLSDGPRGARVLDKKNAVTTFPVGMARASSWNVDLEYKVHEVIAKEMRANKTNYAATPCINLLRHPGWGRAQETYGEDPWLLGEFGIAAVKGIEKHNVMACPKHFALNSIENSRWEIDVSVDERTLREVYLPHFKKVIQKGKPASLMSAYNQVRGEYCGSNYELLTKILREDWGFKGFVSTDWIWGIYDAKKAIKAGLNVEMPWQDEYSYNNIKSLIKSGEISISDIDKLVLNTLKTRLKYAFSYDSIEYNDNLILDSSHINLARKAAEESMVLIKNDKILPFKKDSNLKIGVVGRIANVKNTGDRGSSDSHAPYVITPLEGVKDYHRNSKNKVIYSDASNINDAIEIAKNVDQLIIVVGYTYKDEGEFIDSPGYKIGGDRVNLKLPENDEKLIQELSNYNKNLVVVYVGGSAIDMNNWESKVPSILFSWYSGMEGGKALAKILYGDVNPSGKLPFSIPKNISDYPYFNPFTDTITYGYYHGYTLFEKLGKAISYPFGFGLSYSKFNYKNLIISELNTKDSTYQISFDIENISNYNGKEVVQLYVGFNESKVDRPIKLLRGFKKILIPSKETKNVSFKLNINDLSWYNPEKKKWEIEEIKYKILVGSSSRKNDLIHSYISLE